MRPVILAFAVLLAGCKGQDSQADKLARLQTQMLDPPPRPPPELRVVPAAEIPPDLFVELERKSCYGTCPVYTVAIRSDGVVVFNGHQPHRGCATGKADPQALRRLIGLVQAAGYFEMPAAFAATRMHHPAVVTNIALDGRRHRIDHDGPDERVSEKVEAAARDRLSLVERTIDEVAGTARWLRDDAPPLAETDPLSVDQVKTAAQKQAAPLFKCDFRGEPPPFETEVSIDEDGGVSSLGFRHGHPEADCIKEQLLQWSFPRACGATRAALRIVFQPAPTVTVLTVGPVPRAKR